VHVLTQKALQEQRVLQEAQAALKVLILLALLAQKYTYCHSRRCRCSIYWLY
jgi:hypothetical protein